MMRRCGRFCVGNSMLYWWKVLLRHVEGAKVDVELSSFLITVDEVIRATLFFWRQYVTHPCNADFSPIDACFFFSTCPVRMLLLYIMPNVPNAAMTSLSTLINHSFWKAS